MDQAPKVRAESVEHHLQSRFFYDRFIRKWFLQRNDDTELAENTREEILKRLLSGVGILFGNLFKRKSVEFDQLLEDLARKNFINDEEMLAAVADAVYSFSTNEKNGFTREELEQNYKENRRNKITLNEIVDCNIDRKDSTRIRVHLLGTSNLTPSKIRDGFRVLANKLEHDDVLKNIEVVSLESWMIHNKPRPFQEALGFTVLDITERQQILQERSAEMSKEDFIKRYGKK